MRKAGRFRSAAEGALELEDYETCVSRCYYAAFHAATALLMAHGRPDAEGWRAHQTVIGECIRLGTRRNKWLVGVRMSGRKDFAASLRELYTLRLEADYSSGITDGRRAREAFDFAGEFLIAVNERVP